MRALIFGLVSIAIGGCFNPDSPSASGTDSSADSSGTGGGCPAGSSGCACYGNATCDAGLDCNATVELCIPADCSPGSESCTCNDGVCLAGLECQGGVCVTPSATTDPATTDPATTDPATTDPATTDPATTDPVTTDPATTDPATTDVTTDVTTDPVTTDPATTDTDPTGASQECLDYCGTYFFNCLDYGTQYADEASCLTACSYWAIGAEGDTSGDSVYCRIYHATAAGDDPGAHCPHAQEFPESQCL